MSVVVVVGVRVRMKFLIRAAQVGDIQSRRGLIFFGIGGS